MTESKATLDHQFKIVRECLNFFCGNPPWPYGGGARDSAMKALEIIELNLRQQQEPMTEKQFLWRIKNVTTGWALEGCADRKDALTLIQNLCIKRINETNND